jgi:hypothetical protein
MRVELVYRTAMGELREALTARTKVSRAGRNQRTVMLWGAILLLAGDVVRVATGGSVDAPLVVLPVFFLLALVGLPWLQARQFHKIMAAKGQFRSVVDASGISVESDGTFAHHGWSTLSRYTETAGTFVLLSGDKNASCVTILPKSGAQGPGGVDELRALLDQHLTRV